jgi:hypothetical protein
MIMRNRKDLDERIELLKAKNKGGLDRLLKREADQNSLLSDALFKSFYWSEWFGAALKGLSGKKKGLSGSFLKKMALNALIIVVSNWLIKIVSKSDDHQSSAVKEEKEKAD